MVEIRHFLVTLLLFSGVIIGISALWNSVVINYNIDVPFNTDFLDVSGNITDMAEELKESVERSRPTQSILDLPFIIAQGGLTTLFVTIDSLTIFSSMIDAMSTTMGLPDYVSGIIIGIAIIVIVLSIVSAVLKWKV